MLDTVPNPISKASSVSVAEFSAFANSDLLTFGLKVRALAERKKLEIVDLGIAMRDKNLIFACSILAEHLNGFRSWQDFQLNEMPVFFKLDFGELLSLFQGNSLDAAAENIRLRRLECEITSRSATKAEMAASLRSNAAAAAAKANAEAVLEKAREERAKRRATTLALAEADDLAKREQEARRQKQLEDETHRKADALQKAQLEEEVRRQKLLQEQAQRTEQTVREAEQLRQEQMANKQQAAMLERSLRPVQRKAREVSVPKPEKLPVVVNASSLEKLIEIGQSRDKKRRDILNRTLRAQIHTKDLSLKETALKMNRVGAFPGLADGQACSKLANLLSNLVKWETRPLVTLMGILDTTSDEVLSMMTIL